MALAMDDTSTFLDLPLDRELYQPKKSIRPQKEPLRILLTEANSRIACNLMYKICSGQVFGPDQEVILHLISSKGSVDLNISLAELYGCGFHVLLDAVVSSEPEKSYEKVDIVVIIACFEEMTGHPFCSAFLAQMTKTRQIVKNILQYSKPDTKLVLTSPSTKGVCALMSTFKALVPNFPYNNVTGVIFIDNAIAKASLSAKMKTTTDKIRNIAIWGSTHPDICNTQVYMFPPGDKSGLEKEWIPLSEALLDEQWLGGEFVWKVVRRVIEGDLIKHGMAVAAATAEHLKVLHNGSKKDEIVSMALISPASQPFGVMQGTGFSFPVELNNGKVKIREDLNFSTKTYLLNLREMYALNYDSTMNAVMNVIAYIHEYEKKTRKDFLYSEHQYIANRVSYKSWMLKYIICPTSNEKPYIHAPKHPSHGQKKSITWDDAYGGEGNKLAANKLKSFLRFNIVEENTKGGSVKTIHIAK